MSGIRIEAPAKLNLCLLVGNRRPDGFHGIESLFLALAFGDTLYIEEALQEHSPPVDIRMEWYNSQSNGRKFGDLRLFDDFESWDKTLPPEKNIISRTVSLFRSRTGYDKRLKIAVEKRIPLGSGLGGGSSDAAAALLALNRLASAGGECPLDSIALAEVGAELGSDVPFFLNQESAASWVSGRGEIVLPLALPQAVFGLSFVLVNPGFPSDTAEAYRLLDTYREKHPVQQVSLETQKEFFSVQPKNWQFNNDFLPVFLAKDTNAAAPGNCGTVYREIIGSLRDLGADFAGLSGSGSTCFGVFSAAHRAATAVESLLKRWPFVVRTLPLAR